MGETRHDLWLKRINTWIAIVGGSIASIAGAYNFSSLFPAAPGEISAVVRTSGGAPVARAHVELLTSEKALLATSETDRAGRYVRKELEPGSYVVKVSRSGFEPQITAVSVASKKTTDVELILRSQSRAQAPATAQATASSQAEGSVLRSALEETGASLIKSFGQPRK